MLTRLEQSAAAVQLSGAGSCSEACGGPSLWWQSLTLYGTIDLDLGHRVQLNKKPVVLPLYSAGQWGLVVPLRVDPESQELEFELVTLQISVQHSAPVHRNVPVPWLRPCKTKPPSSSHHVVHHLSVSSEAPPPIAATTTASSEYANRSVQCFSPHLSTARTPACTASVDCSSSSRAAKRVEQLTSFTNSLVDPGLLTVCPRHEGSPSNRLTSLLFDVTQFSEFSPGSLCPSDS